MFTIIEEITINAEGFLNYNPVGYTSDEVLKNQINEAYDDTLGAFLGENRTRLELGEVSISDFFNVTSSVNEARTEADTVDGLNINEVLSINEL